MVAVPQLSELCRHCDAFVTFCHSVSLRSLFFTVSSTWNTDSMDIDAEGVSCSTVPVTYFPLTLTGLAQEARRVPP